MNLIIVLGSYALVAYVLYCAFMFFACFDEKVRGTNKSLEELEKERNFFDAFSSLFEKIFNPIGCVMRWLEGSSVKLYDSRYDKRYKYKPTRREVLRRECAEKSGEKWLDFFSPDRSSSRQDRDDIMRSLEEELKDI